MSASLSAASLRITLAGAKQQKIAKETKDSKNPTS
jgi:hypothetical protein